jgi:uncharacterized iron-regulated membrane protein
MFRHLVVLAVALGLTWMIFFGAGYFGAVWTHYFSGEPAPKNTGEVSATIINQRAPKVYPCSKAHPCPFDGQHLAVPVNPHD